jgi:capsular polysaccharide transport system permease protein
MWKMSPSDPASPTEPEARVEESAGESAAALTARAISLIGSGDLAEAQRLLTDSVAIDGGIAGAYYWIAFILRMRSQPGDAIDALHEHKQVRPADDLACLLWAECLMDLSRPKEAQGYLLKAMEINRLHLTKPAVERCEKLLGRQIRPNITKPDYSWVDWRQIEVPADYKMSMNVADFNRLGTSFLQSLVIHVEVVGALIHREILTRYGRSRLGYLWALFQPLIFVATMYFVFAVAGRRLPEGVWPIGFLLTGIVSFRFFSETRERVGNSIKGNLPLLYFRQVTLFSVIVARTALEFLTNLVIFALLVGIAYLLGEKINIRGPLEILWGFILLTLLGLELGLIVAVFGKVFPAIENLSSSISRTLFFVSGLWFYANELSHHVRSLLLVNPLFHILEIIREGYFVSYDAKYASLTYVHAWVLVGGVLALSLKRVMHHRLLDT